MAKVKFTVMCNAIYHSELELPDDVKDEDVLCYIHDHLDDAPVKELEWLSDIDPDTAVTKEDIREIER